jgi:hypothetical protein
MHSLTIIILNRTVTLRCSGKERQAALERAVNQCLRHYTTRYTKGAFPS